MKNKAALELSVSTIVVIVLAITMLILGIVLVRSIMCGAVGLTGEINSKVKGEIDRLFQSSAGEVVCVGGGADAISLIPGKINTIYCGIDNTGKDAEYEIKVKRISGDILKEKDIEEWIQGNINYKSTISSKDKDPKKILYLKVPEGAPNDLIIVDVEVYKDGTLIRSPSLSFEVKSVGFFKAAMC